MTLMTKEFNDTNLINAFNEGIESALKTSEQCLYESVH